VDAVGVGGIGGVFDGDPADGDVVASDGVERPETGVGQGNAIDQDIAAIDDANQTGSDVAEFFVREQVPPHATTAVDRAATDDGDVFQAFTANQSGVGGFGGAFPLANPDGESRDIGHTEKFGAGLQMQGDVAAHPKRSGE